MKQRAKKWWQRRPRFRWGQKLALNLGLCALMATLLWGMADYPLPTAQLEFRRLERTNLCPPSQMVFVAPHDTNDLLGQITLYDRWVVGTREAQVHVGMLNGEWSHLKRYPLGNGPSPVPMDGNVGWLSHEPGQRSRLEIGSALLFLQVPQQTQRAELTLDGTYMEQEYHRDCHGWNLKKGIWIFAVEPPEDSFSSDWYLGSRYVLTLYDEEGQLLSRHEGSIPACLP